MARRKLRRGECRRITTGRCRCKLMNGRIKDRACGKPRRGSVTRRRRRS